MAEISVKKVEDTGAELRPLFQEIEKQFEAVRRRAFDLFEKRGREFGHALDDWLKAEHDVMGWPAAELKEGDSKYELSMTLPGYEAKDVQVTATPSEIMVHANVEAEKKVEGETCLWTEFASNDVCRRFRLPDAIDPDTITASLDKGMLHITAAKVSKPQARPIEVKAA